MVFIAVLLKFLSAEQFDGFDERSGLSGLAVGSSIELQSSLSFLDGHVEEHDDDESSKRYQSNQEECESPLNWYGECDSGNGQSDQIEKKPHFIPYSVLNGSAVFLKTWRNLVEILALNPFYVPLREGFKISFPKFMRNRLAYYPPNSEQ